MRNEVVVKLWSVLPVQRLGWFSFAVAGLGQRPALRFIECSCCQPPQSVGFLFCDLTTWGIWFFFQGR